MHSTLERIAAARPNAALHPEQHVGTAERAEILETLLSSATMEVGSPTPVHWSSIVRRGIAGVGVAAVALALGLLGNAVASSRMDHGSPQDTNRPPTASKSIETVGAVKAHLTAALTDVDDIESTRSRFDLGSVGVVRENRWTSPDGRTIRVQTSLNDQQQYDETMVTIGGTTHATVIDYPDRAWWTWSEPSDTPVCPSSAACQATIATDSLSPSSIENEVQEGTLHVTSNRQLIAGHETIELSGSAAQAAPDLGTFDLWIDASTYLPVRTANTGLHGATSSSDFQWMASTPTNLAQLRVIVPSGFTRSPVPITPAHGAAPGLG
jgi:hypothetical protein